MNEENLINYYNKFNEDKRLTRRHGIVEFSVTTRYITRHLRNFSKADILDVGAGTGKYSSYFSNLGCNVSALELVKHNLKVIEKNYPSVKTYLGNAIDLSRFDNNSFDIVLLFGPMYHLISFKDKVKALNEAKRVVRNNGYIFVSYYMNDYAVMKHGFIDNHIIESITNNKLDKDFHVISNDNDLYSYSTIKDIDRLKNECGLERVNIISQDGLSDYFRREINSMSDKEFNIYINYIYSICEKNEFLGFSSHVLDILKKTE